MHMEEQLDEAIAWGMQHGFVDDDFAAEYRARVNDPNAVHEFIGMMAIYARVLHPPVLTKRESLVVDRQLVESGQVPAFFAPYLGVNL
jgi:hypothetical protein